MIGAEFPAPLSITLRNQFVFVTEKTMSKLFENAGHRRGGATKTAKDYWDRTLSLEETASLLQVRISDLRAAVQGKPMKNCVTPEVHSISESGSIAFVGKSVQQIVESKVKTARNKKELFG